MRSEGWFFRFVVRPHAPRGIEADTNHPHWRRYTARYRRKQGIVKNLWIGSGLAMLVIGSLPTTFALALGTTFLSFVILDETP